MPLPRLASFLLGLSMLSSLPSSANALNDSGAKAVIAKFIASQKIEDAQASAGLHAMADLNGDGKADIVLQWDVLGPTWSLPKLSVFLDQGKSYRTLTTDLTGQIEKLSVNGSTILLDTLIPGPKDPRCCPSVKKRVTYRWANDKLVLTK